MGRRAPSLSPPPNCRTTPSCVENVAPGSIEVSIDRGSALLGDRSAEDALQTRLVGFGSRKGTNWAGRAGDIMQRPPSWAAVAALLAATGTTGRRAALRGGVCYLSAAAAHLPIKALVGRRHPPGSALHQLGPVTSSFPSGHAAADLALVFGASQEMPRAFLPLSCASLAVHWTLAGGGNPQPRPTRFVG